jgi:two-component system KDP operon response regulator KdpE
MADHALILIVEDDAEIGRFLSTSLAASGYIPSWKKSLAEARGLITTSKPNLLILDLTLPDGDGQELIRELRGLYDLPIIVLSARQSEQEKVACFALGADDYLSKPFGINELLARIRVCLKRSSMMQLRDNLYVLDGLRIDRAKQQVQLNDEALHLTPIEFKLLMLLASEPGKVFSHRQLLTGVWGAEYVDETHYLRIHMGRLRARIEQEPASPRFILTELGIGYRLASA